MVGENLCRVEMTPGEGKKWNWWQHGNKKCKTAEHSTDVRREDSGGCCLLSFQDRDAFPDVKLALLMVTREHSEAYLVYELKLECVNYLSKPGLHRWQCFAFQDVKQKTLFSSLDYQGVKISPLLSCLFLWKHLKWCCKLISQKAPTCSTGIGCPEMCGCPILGGFRGWVG